MTLTRIGHDAASGMFVITEVGIFPPRTVAITVDGDFVIARTVADQVEMRAHWSRLARLDGTPFSDVGAAAGYAVSQAEMLPVAQVVRPVTSVVMIVADDPIHQGSPVAINRANGRVVPADALLFHRSIVCGFAAADTDVGHPCQVDHDPVITLPDWTALAGSQQLETGRIYFVAEGGGITVQQPTAKGSAVGVIGESLSPYTLSTRRSSSILL